MNPRENRPADPFGSGMAAYPDIPFSRNRLLHWLIGVYAVLWAILAIAPLDRMQWLMENLLPVGAVVALACTYRKFRFSNVSYILIFVFLCIHTFAAHYTYQNTPVDVWIKAVMHTQRSYFDRFVHFFFGPLMAYPFREVLMRLAGLRGFWSYVLPAALVFAFSSLFEIIEMFVALAPDKPEPTISDCRGTFSIRRKIWAWDWRARSFPWGFSHGCTKRLGKNGLPPHTAEK
ncbi:DUF2238 domain-containing protein [Paenibacillus sp. P25]|nr:DUF2238 domain-containing protein [Paenibacillus sp. P25]